MAEIEDFHQKAPKNDILNVLLLFENVRIQINVCDIVYTN